MSQYVAVCGDLHCGSTVGLCPPEGMELDDGGLYEPSEAQGWLWENWTDAWRIVKRLTRGKTLHLIVNGDVVDGDHHRTAQIASPLTGVHFRCAKESLRVPLALKPKSIHVMRGTPVHVGRSGDVEEGLARSLRSEGWPVVEDPDTGKATSYRRRIDVEGVRLDVAHHGRMGQRAHTRGSYSRLYGFDIWAEQMLETYVAMRQSDDPLSVFNDKRPPDIALRSHNHKYQDTGIDHRGVTRVVSMPAWQLATEYVHRIAAESLADIGMVLIRISENTADVRPLLYPAERSSILSSP